MGNAPLRRGLCIWEDKVTTEDTIRFIRSNHQFIYRSGAGAHEAHQYIRGLIMMAKLQGVITYEQSDMLLEEVQIKVNYVLDSNKPSN